MENHSLGAERDSAARAARSASRSPTPRDEVTSAILASAVKLRLGARERRQRVRRRADRLHPVHDQATAAAPRPTTPSSARPSPTAAGAGRGNLTVATRTRVGRLLFDGRRVVGVRVRRSAAGARGTSRARREVIVCAGTVETPLLLERSGIGRPDAAPRGGHRAPHRVAQRRRARHRAARHRAAGHARRRTGSPRAG